MRELIDREAVIDLLKKMRKDGDMLPWEGKDVFARIRKLPTIQPEERTEKRTETHGVCLDAISRQAAIEKFAMTAPQMSVIRIYEAVEILESMPPAQPEPHKGHWIWVAGELMCSECRTIYSDLYPDYDNSVACPHCGAKMTISTK